MAPRAKLTPLEAGHPDASCVREPFLPDTEEVAFIIKIYYLVKNEVKQLLLWQECRKIKRLIQI